MTNTLIKQTAEQMVQLRQRIHQYPELAYQEFQTANLVAQELRSYGLHVTTGIAETGVAALLKKSDGPTVAFRADMDALPIVESNALAYCSSHAGVMHACGHDGHTAMLLGAAKVLSQMDSFAGNILFIFQPAEENEGGAKSMLDAGLFEQFPVDSIYGLHNIPGVPLGTVMAQPGPVSAAFDIFDIAIEGRGGHGAIPDLAADPIVAASALIQSFNTIVSRKVSPLDSAVVSIGKLSAGDTYNVIPERADIKGSCRSFNQNVQTLLKQQILNMCRHVGQAYGVNISCKYEEKYPAVINDENATKVLQEAVHEWLPKTSMITEFKPFMGSEDFSYFLNAKSGCYFGLGNGEDSAALHTPQYNFNDALLEKGIDLWVAIAKQCFSPTINP
ncbi:M20 metallopeptidase family protein [Ningiella sp. W23]|uniref:M20 metallopeptidase family protein n=1 Tax=Ningiella sp. W23 TaxID=3023715 RepID=UPI00375652DC